MADTPTEITINPLNILFAELEKDMGSNDVKKMKNLLRGTHIANNDMDMLTSASDVFHHLNDHGYIGVKTLTLLEQLFEVIDKESLKRKLRDFQRYNNDALKVEANLHLQETIKTTEPAQAIERQREQLELNKEKHKQKFKEEIMEELRSEWKKLYEFEKARLIDENSPDVVKKLNEAFERYMAKLEKIAEGSLIFMLSFLLEEELEYFWQKYMEGDVENVLGEILITPKMRSLAEECGLTASIRLNIDKKEYENFKEMLRDMPSVYTISRIVNELKPDNEDKSSDDFKSLIDDLTKNTKPAFEFKVTSLSDFKMVAKLARYHETLIKHRYVMGTSNARVKLKIITIDALNNIVWNCHLIEIMIHALSRQDYVENLCLVGFNETFITTFLKIQSKMKMPLEIRKLGIQSNGLTMNVVNELLESVKYYPLLKELDLSHNNLDAVDCIPLLPLADDVTIVVDHNGIKTGALGNEQHTTKVESVEDYLSLVNVDNIGQLKEKMAKVTELKASALPNNVAKILLTNISLFSGLKILNACACIEVEDPDYVHSFCTGIGSLVFLERLFLRNNRIGDAGVESLSKSMTGMKNVRQLDISHNCITYVGASSVTGMLKKLTELEYVDLSNNHIGSRGVAALCDGLQKCNKLTHLLLGRNRIGDEGVKDLSKDMVFLKDLEHFDISGNQIGDKGFKAVCKGLKHLKQLKHLDASQNVIADVGLKRLAKNARFLGNLQYLDLSHNEIEKTELVPLSQEMKYMKMLEKLDLSHNEMGTADAKYLCKALKDMKNLRWLQVEDAFKDIDIKVKEELYKEAKRLNVEIDDSSKNTKGTKEVTLSEPRNDERKAFVERQESFCSRTSTTSHVSSCSSRG